MIQLTRKVEPRDIINALTPVSVHVAAILRKGKLAPSELFRLIEVMEGLLALRDVFNVQKFSDNDAISKAAENMWELATGVINRARILLISGPDAEVDGLLDAYCDAIDAGLYAVGLLDRNLEESYKLALQWTTN